MRRSTVMLAPMSFSPCAFSHALSWAMNASHPMTGVTASLVIQPVVPIGSAARAVRGLAGRAAERDPVPDDAVRLGLAVDADVDLLTRQAADQLAGLAGQVAEVVVALRREPLQLRERDRLDDRNLDVVVVAVVLDPHGPVAERRTAVLAHAIAYPVRVEVELSEGHARADLAVRAVEPPPLLHQAAARRLAVEGPLAPVDLLVCHAPRSRACDRLCPAGTIASWERSCFALAGGAGVRASIRPTAALPAERWSASTSAGPVGSRTGGAAGCGSGGRTAAARSAARSPAARLRSAIGARA